MPKEKSHKEKLEDLKELRWEEKYYNQYPYNDELIKQLDDEILELKKIIEKEV